MATSQQLRRLATNPHDLMRFQRTGQLPEGVKPSSPLITLLERISPRDRGQILGLRVDEGLGYAGSREFHTAAQALNWLKPAPEVFGTFYADSWRLKDFQRQLFLEDMMSRCSSFPEHVAARYQALRRPAARSMPRP